jgi:hypothetical protein
VPAKATEARDELDQVIEEIQGIPGFDTFLATPTMDDVAAAADQDPLVYLTAAEQGGLALIVSEVEVAHVPATTGFRLVIHPEGTQSQVFSTSRSSLKATGI